MLDFLSTATVLFHERQRRGEDAFAPLPGLDGACDEAFAVADALDVVQDRNLRVAGEHKVAVHAVNCEVRRNGGLRRGEALRNRRAPKDAARPGRMPERTGVGVDVWSDVDQRKELEDVLDGRMVRKRFGWFDQRCVCRHDQDSLMREQRSSWREKVQRD